MLSLSDLARTPGTGPGPSAGAGSGEEPLVRAVDALLEASVIGSFSVVGYEVRRRLGHWGEPPRLDGKVVVVTGGSSGIGRAAAVGVARLGADVWLLGRDRNRLDAAAGLVEEVGAGAGAHVAALDVADAGAVTGFADRVTRSEGGVDGVIHAAGALLRSFERTPDNTERTVATHVLAPFRLTWLLSPLLRKAGGGTVVTVSSGGMYTQPLDLDRLEMTEADYDGVRAYARAKRAQVVLTHAWARRWAGDGVAAYAMHPGWVDTPGLATGLPGFRHLRWLLRTPDQGADTAVWLAADGPRRQAATEGRSAPSDGFWHDRRARAEYRFPGRRRPSGAGAAADEDRLWDWCAARTGVGGRHGGNPSPR